MGRILADAREFITLERSGSNLVLRSVPGSVSVMAIAQNLIDR